MHDNYKQLVVDTAETGTVFLNRFHKPGFRVLAHAATARSASSERPGADRPSSTACSTSTSAATSTRRSRSAARSRAASTRCSPVAEIIDETIAEFHEILQAMAARYPSS